MSDMSEAEEAIKNLHLHQLHGWRMNVEMSKQRSKSSTKLHVSNLREGVTSELLQAKFEDFGPVVECDILKDYAFVHMERMEDAMDAINKLDNTAFKGKLMSVQLSTSRLRTAPGMGNHAGCFVCGKHGHWLKDCPIGHSDSHSDGMRGRSGRPPPRGPPSYGSGSYGMASPPGADYTAGSMYSRGSYGGVPPPPPRSLSSYGSELGDRYTSRSSAYDRVFSSVDYYQKYRANPYGSSYFENRRMSFLPPPPPPPFSLSKVDPYSHQPLAPPSSAAAYNARERSPIRRVPVSLASYSHERTQLSPVSASKSSYAIPRPKDYYAPRYTPY